MNTLRLRGRTAERSAPPLTAERVWRELGKASFAVISYVTPTGKPRATGVMCAAGRRRLYVATAPDSWKARQISDGDEVAVTVPIRRGGLLSLVAPIPPATVSFHARVKMHPVGSVNIAAVSKRWLHCCPRSGDEPTAC